MLFYMARYKLGWLDGPFGKTSADDWWWGISPEGFGAVAMLVNAGLALLVSRLSPKPPTAVVELVESIRYPRGAEEAVGGH